MRVDPTSSVSGPANVPPDRTEPKPVKQHEKVNCADSAKLLRAMEDIPATRADQIARAKALIKDPTYPNDATLRQVANILADQLKPENPSK